MKGGHEVPLAILTKHKQVRKKEIEDETRRIVLIYRAIHNAGGRAGSNNFLSSTRRNFVPILLLHYHHHFCPLFSFFILLPLSSKRAADTSAVTGNLRQEAAVDKTCGNVMGTYACSVGALQVTTQLS
jgi:hypothetical protein